MFCPKAHFDKQLHTRRVSIPFVKFQRGVESRFVVNCHLALHGGEKIGNIMIHVSSINAPLGRIKLDETYVIEGALYGKPHRAYEASLSGRAFESLSEVWEFAKAVGDRYKQPEKTKEIYRAFFTILSVTDIHQREELSDGPWIEGLVEACEYASQDFDHFLWANSREAGVHDIGKLQKYYYYLLNDALRQSVTAVVEIFEEMLKDSTKHHCIEQSFRELQDIRWMFARSKLGDRLDNIEAALGKGACNTPGKHLPSLGGISLSFYRVG